MGKVFKIFDRIEPSKVVMMLPDKTYVDEQIKHLRDELLHKDDIGVGINMNTPEEINMIMPGSEPIKASRIAQDPEHCMMTASQLSIFRSKPSKQEVQDLINDAIKKSNTKLEELFTNLLNNEHAIDKLRTLMNILKDDDTVISIIEMINDTITLDDMAEHIKSNKHVNNTDRKALNLMLEAMKSGALAKLANGHIEHADTADSANKLAGLTPEQLTGHKLDQVIYGAKEYCDVEHVDKILEPDENGFMDKSFMNHQKLRIGCIGFKPGVYAFDTFSTKFDIPYTTPIHGSGSGTMIKANTVKIKSAMISNALFTSYDKQLKFEVGDTSHFENCVFEDCNIIIHDSMDVSFRLCRFIDCRIEIDGYSHAVFIINNLYNDKTTIPTYFSKGVIIKDNIRM